jgi:hypothetical protein
MKIETWSRPKAALLCCFIVVGLAFLPTCTVRNEGESGSGVQGQREVPLPTDQELILQIRGYLQYYAVVDDGVRLSKYMSIDSVHALDRLTEPPATLEIRCGTDMSVQKPFDVGSPVDSCFRRYFFPAVEFRDKRLSKSKTGLGFGPIYEYERTSVGDRYHGKFVIKIERISSTWRVQGLRSLQSDEWRTN